MSIPDALFNAARGLVNTRYPGAAGGAAAVRTASGSILTSTAPQIKNDSLNVCHETVAYPGPVYTILIRSAEPVFSG